MKKKLIIIFSIINVLLLSLFGAVHSYLSDYYHADTIATSSLESTDNITITDEDDYIVFKPKEYTTGIIFYPGGKVEADSYAPLCEEYAENRIMVVLVKMPKNIPFLGQNRADKIVKDQSVEHWYMAGHSLGGLCASNYISSHVDEYDGLILLASYSLKDLSDTELKVLSLYGSKDGILNMDNYEKYRTNLPSTTIEEILYGGNHSQFGSYGLQEGDGVATISATLQVEETVQYTKILMEE